MHEELRKNPMLPVQENNPLHILQLSIYTIDQKVDCVDMSSYGGDLKVVVWEITNPTKEGTFLGLTDLYNMYAQ